MTMNLHTQTTAPKASQATSVSPLEQSGSSKTKFSRGKSKARAGAVKTDLYQTVTDSIIAALESGVKPWVCPWVRNGAAAGLPANFSTGTAYSGINIMLLWCSAAKQGFRPNRRSGRQRNGHNSGGCWRCRPIIHAERQNYSACSRWKKSGAWGTG